MTTSICSNGTEDLKITMSNVTSNEDDVDNQNDDASQNEQNTAIKETESATETNETCIPNKIEQNQELNNPIEILKKLEIIKEIKNKTNDLDKIKSKLIEEVDIIETETKSMQSYQSELEALMKEKLEQMEILRQIQDDIQTMEITIKQADEDKKRSVQSAIQLHMDYEPLKKQINDLRDSIGLEKLNDNIDISILENYLNKFNPFGHKQEKLIPKNESTPSSAVRDGLKMNSKYQDREEQPNNLSIQGQISIPIFNPFTGFNQSINRMRPQDYSIQSNQFNNTKTSRPKSPPRMPQITTQITSDEFNKHFSQFIMNQNKSSLPTQQPQQQQQQQQQQQTQVSSMPPSFRQQPPPMKSCLSCNQQIHRNAPICPLCKAKSRSRNPKKPKKKSGSDQFSSSMSPPAK